MVWLRIGADRRGHRQQPNDNSGGAGEELVRRALQALLDHLSNFEHRVTVETWNGGPVLESGGRSLLESVGFYRDYPGMTWEGLSSH